MNLFAKHQTCIISALPALPQCLVSMMHLLALVISIIGFAEFSTAGVSDSPSVTSPNVVTTDGLMSILTQNGATKLEVTLTGNQVYSLSSVPTHNNNGTLYFDASNRTITDPYGDFVREGFTPGMPIEIVSSNADDAEYVIASVSPTEMRVEGELTVETGNGLATVRFVIPSWIHLRITLGASISVPPRTILKINSSLEAGRYTCFSGEGRVLFSSKISNVDEVYPEWFDDNLPRTAAASPGKKISLRGGKIYLLSECVYFSSPFELTSAGTRATIKAITPTRMISIAQNLWRYSISNLTLDGNNLANEGIVIAEGAATSNTGYAEFSQIDIKRMAGSGFVASGLIYSTIHNIQCFKNGKDGFTLDNSSNANTIDNLSVHDNGHIDLSIPVSSNNNIFHNVSAENAEGATEYQMIHVGGNQNIFENLYLENDVCPSSGIAVHVSGNDNIFVGGYYNSSAKTVMQIGDEGRCAHGNRVYDGTWNLWGGIQALVHLSNSSGTRIERNRETLYDSEILILHSMKSFDTFFAPFYEKSRYKVADKDISLDLTHFIMEVDTSKGEVFVSLPKASNFRGKEYLLIKKSTDTNKAYVGPGISNSDGGTFVIGSTSDFVRLISDGSSWKVLECSNR